MVQQSEIAAVILAGGKASRMNHQDKALLTLHGTQLVQHVIARAKNQVAAIALSVNHNSHLYKHLQLPLIADCRNQYAGPLVGIYSAMRHFAASEQHSNIKYLACFAADVPHFPTDVIHRLTRELTDSDNQLALCSYGSHIQPLLSIWKMETITVVESAIDRGLFGPKQLLAEIPSVVVEIPPDEEGYFLNINSAETLAKAEKLICAN